MYFWLKFPRIVPFGQCLSLSQSPPTLPPSPLLLSPPPCCQLHILISHLAHSRDQSLSKAGDSCHADSPPDVPCLNGEVGLLLCLPPRICQLLLLTSCLCHCWNQFVDRFRSFTKTSKGDTKKRNGVQTLADWAIVSLIVFHISWRCSSLVLLIAIVRLSTALSPRTGRYHLVRPLTVLTSRYFLEVPPRSSGSSALMSGMIVWAARKASALLRGCWGTRSEKTP